MNGYGTRSDDWWLVVIRGVAALFLGLAALTWPGLTLAALVILFGAYLLVDGATALVHAFRQRDGHWFWHLAQGLLGLAAGLLSLLVPGLAALALVVLIAWWAILTGASEIALAVQLRHKMSGEWLWAIAGLLSIAFGVVVLLFPIAGLLATVWIVATYTLLLGVVWISLGLSTRGAQRRTVAS